MAPHSPFKPIFVSRERGSSSSGVSIWQGSPDDFDPSGKEIIFAITPPRRRGNEARMAKLLASEYHVEKLARGNVYIVSSKVQVPQVLTIYKNPFTGSKDCSPSPPSDAHYYLQYSEPMCGILWQSLVRRGRRPYAQTSCHWHADQKECWLVLDGCGTLYSRPGSHPNAPWHNTVMNPGDCITVHPGTQHQLRTETGLSTFLVMTGNAQGFSLNDHYYVKPPPEGLRA